MARLTERWGPDANDIAGRAKCQYLECDSNRPCRECPHGIVNNRLADYEDAIPYERLQEAAELLKQKDLKKKKRYSVVVNKHKREKEDKTKTYYFVGYTHGDHVVGIIPARNLDEAKERMRNTYEDFETWIYCNIHEYAWSGRNVLEIYYGS